MYPSSNGYTYNIDMILDMSTMNTKQDMGKMIRIEDDVHEDLKVRFKE